MPSYTGSDVACESVPMPEMGLQGLSRSTRSDSVNIRVVLNGYYLSTQQGQFVFDTFDKLVAKIRELIVVEW